MPRKMSALASLASLALVLNAAVASAQPSLGSAGAFGVLGATTVTNTGISVVTGDLGVSPGTAITGFLAPPANTVAGPGTVTAGPGLVTGTIYAGGAIAAQAHAAAFVASETIKEMPCLPANNLTGQDLGTLMSPLPPGVYCFDTSAQLTGNLTLIGTGPWIFQIGSTLTTASLAAVLVPDVATCRGANVFWQVGSSATLGTGTQFVGNVLATTSITATAGVNVSGSLLAINGAVTMDTNEVSACGPGTVPPIPDPCKCKCRRHHHHDGDHDGDHDDDDDGDHDDDDDGHHDDDDDGHHGDKDRDKNRKDQNKDKDRDNDKGRNRRGK